MPTAIPRRAWSIVGAAWLLTLAALAPQTASAACGAGGHLRVAVSTEGLGVGDLAVPTIPARLPDAPPPCPGGICSRDSSTPAGSTTTPIPLAWRVEFGSFDLYGTAAPPPSTPLPRADRAAAPPRPSASPPERPPRRTIAPAPF